MTPQSFKDSQESLFRRIVRDAIRKGPFTRAERDVTLAVVNHWFHHKGGAKPFIHPSREHIAKKAKVSVKTVSRALDVLRTINALAAVSGIGGGKAKATRYKLNLPDLMAYCGANWLDEFMRGYGENVPVSGGKMSRYVRDKMSHCLMTSDHTPAKGGF